MPEQPEVVILGADGTEHVFPPGFNPKRAAAIVRGQGSPQAAQQQMQTDPAFLQGMQDPFTGFFKGAADTAFNLGKIVRDYTPIGRISDAILPNAFSAENRPQPTNEAQRLGYGLERLAEFAAVPSGAGTVATDALAQGAGSALITKAQGGSGGDVATSAVLGAAGPAVGAAMPLAKRAGAALKESAKTNVSQALAPTGKRMKRMAEQVAPGILERGVYAPTKQGIVNKAEGELSTLSEAYDAANAALPQGARLATDDARLPIRAAMRELLTEGSSGNAVPVNPQKYAALKELDDTLGDLGDNVSRETLQVFKEEWQDRVAKAGGYAEKVGDALTTAELWAKRKGAEAIQRVLAEDSPDIAKLNAEWSFWSKVRDVSQESVNRQRPQKGALRRVAGMAGAVAGFGKGGPAGAAVGATVMSQVTRAMDSPGWKLASAHAKNKLADALMSDNPERVTSALGRVMASIPSQYRVATAQ